MRPELEPLRQQAGGQHVRPGDRHPRPDPVDQPVQPDRLDPVEGHGHAAAVPAAEPDQLVQQIRQHRAQPQQRRRPVERPAMGAEVLMS